MINNTKKTPVCVDELLAAYRAKKRVHARGKFVFEGVAGMDVYNISKRFELDGEAYIAGRVERRDSELSSVVMFRQVSGDVYRAVEGSDIPLLQDPCIVETEEGIALGGTKVFVEDGRIVRWRTAFYRGKSIDALTEFAHAPDGMKDARFIAYGDKTAVFTRPQGGAAGPGKIGFVMLNSPDDISPEALSGAALLDCFAPTEWGGANDLFVLKNGWIAVAGHIAKMSLENGEQYRHYYPVTFAYHPLSGEQTPLKIIAERADFIEGPSKRPDLVDVIFTGGLVRKGDGTAVLYAGTSDAEGQYLVIDDPLTEYEALPPHGKERK